MKVRYIAGDTDKFKNGQIFRIMFNEEAKVKFKGTHQPMFWEDDKVVRLVIQENPFKGIFISYPLCGIWEKVNG